MPIQGHDSDLDDIVKTSDDDVLSMPDDSASHATDSDDDKPMIIPQLSTDSSLLLPLLEQMNKAHKSLATTVKSQLYKFDKKTQRRLDEKIRLKGVRNSAEHKRFSATLKVLQETTVPLTENFIGRIKAFIEDYDGSEDVSSAQKRMLGKVRRMKWPKKFDVEELIALLDVDTKTVKKDGKYKRQPFQYRQQSQSSSQNQQLPNADTLQLAQLLALSKHDSRPLCPYCQKPGHPPEKCYSKFPSLKATSSQP